MKKISFILSLCILLSSFFGSNAVLANINDVQSTKITEYEIYKRMLEKDDKELKLMGYTDKAIENLRNFDWIEELELRAKMNDEDLKFLGYSEADIIILRNNIDKFKGSGDIELLHDGGSDSGGLFATLSLSTYRSSSSDYYVAVRFDWDWDKTPVYFGGTEILAFAWNGTDYGGYSLNVTMNTSKSYHNVYVRNNMIGNEWKSPGFKINNVYGSATSEFAYGYRVDDMINWAQRGAGLVYFDRTGNAPLKQIGLNISYGHATYMLGGDVKFSPPYLDIGFTGSLEKMASVSDTYGTK